MPRNGSKHVYKPKREYTYSVKDVAELAGNKTGMGHSDGN
jgi:hypothetical protein